MAWLLGSSALSSPLPRPDESWRDNQAQSFARITQPDRIFLLQAASTLDAASPGGKGGRNKRLLQMFVLPECKRFQMSNSSLTCFSLPWRHNCTSGRVCMKAPPPSRGCSRSLGALSCSISFPRVSANVDAQHYYPAAYFYNSFLLFFSSHFFVCTASAASGAICQFHVHACACTVRFKGKECISKWWRMQGKKAEGCSD